MWTKWPLLLLTVIIPDRTESHPPERRVVNIAASGRVVQLVTFPEQNWKAHLKLKLPY
jgi:hypothetical protein